MADRGVTSTSTGHIRAGAAVASVGGGPTLARAIVFVVMIGFGAVASISIVQRQADWVSIVLGLLYMVAVLALQTLYFIRPGVVSSPYRYPALLVQAALVYLPQLQFGQGWVALPGFLAGSVLLVLPRMLALPAFVVVVASMGVLQDAYSGMPYDIVYTVVSTIITGCVIFGLTRLASLLDEVSATRLELASLAVKAERARFSQDVHDLLGFGLSAIGLKAELAERLLTTDVDSARDQIGDIRDISRRASEDLRAVARGERQLSLAGEARLVGTVLGIANIDATVDADVDDLPVETATTLALILREGITNVIRHSQARRCDVTLRRSDTGVLIEIVNDGVLTGAFGSAPGSSNGLTNLDRRARALGGTFRAGSADGRTFVLRADLPCAAVAEMVHSQPDS